MNTGIMNELRKDKEIIYNLNDFLFYRQIDCLPSSLRQREEAINSVKVLFMMLIKNYRYDILSKLMIPEYIESQVKVAINEFFRHPDEKRTLDISYVALFNIFNITNSQFHNGKTKLSKYFFNRLLMSYPKTDNIQDFVCEESAIKELCYE